MNDDRYRLGEELGHGGLGRVVGAWDSNLERDVAIKLVLDGLPAELADRFVREAKLTGRLAHPNIVPVYDLAEIGAPDGQRRLALTMKRVQGRDLRILLADLARGDARTVETYSRGRLLALFQEICLGVAFAHSKGIIHRDLKPANVMIGDFGETLIVDWGLAKEFGNGSAAGSGPVEGIPDVSGGAKTVVPIHGSGSSAVTLDGDIVGTPAYMSPEQADGRQSDVDARSDIYALGAILYEILTFRPPVDGDSLAEILSQAKSGVTIPPSGRLRTGDPKAASIPPELDAIVMRALSVRREDRYQSALDLHREIQLFLEGVKERARRLAEGLERAAAGRRLLERYHALESVIVQQGLEVKRLMEQIKPHVPIPEKRPLWDAEAQLQALREERIDVFTKANAQFGQALIASPDLPEALEGKCELFLDKILEAEGSKNREQLLLNHRTLAQYDRFGKYKARLEAPGKVSLRTFAYSCGCLAPVASPRWRVEFAEEPDIPWREGRPWPGAALGEDDRPVPQIRLHPAGSRWGHSAACPRQEVRGVEVWIAGYSVKDRRLVTGEARLLGETPIEGLGLPQGSWLLTLRPRPPLAETRVPVAISRDAHWQQDVTLFAPTEIPDGFIHVPAGPFTFGGTGSGATNAAMTLTARDFFIERFPVTCAQYLDFLNDLAAGGRIDEARRRQPREGEKRWWQEAGGKFRLPLPQEDERFAWEPRWPVFSINWQDALEYAAWRSGREKRLYTLPHEEEHEKASRGVDGRSFSFGNTFDAGYAHGLNSLEGRMSPLPVGSYPVDESPYGVRDTCGGASTWCLNAPEVPWRSFAVVRGGNWCNDPSFAYSAKRAGTLRTNLHWNYGIRLVARPEVWPGTAP